MFIRYVVDGRKEWNTYKQVSVQSWLINLSFILMISIQCWSIYSLCCKIQSLVLNLPNFNFISFCFANYYNFYDQNYTFFNFQSKDRPFLLTNYRRSLWLFEEPFFLCSAKQSNTRGFQFYIVGELSEFLRLPRILAAIYLVSYKYQSPTILGSPTFIYSYSKLPSSRFTFFSFLFLSKFYMIFKNYFLFYSSILGRQRYLTVYSIKRFIFSFFSNAVFLYSTLLSIQVVFMSQLDLYFDCICYCCISIIFQQSQSRYFLCLSFSARRSSYFFQCSYNALVSTAQNIECLSLITFLRFQSQFFQYRWQQLCYNFLKRGGCWAKLLDINLQSLSLSYRSCFSFYLFSYFCLTFFSNSSFLSFINFSFMSFYSCYFFNFSYYSFFLCYSASLVRYYLSFFCFFMNYSYSFSFSYFISNGLKRDSDCCPPFISSILSFMSNNLRWIYVDWSRNMLNFLCFNYSSPSPYLVL